MIGTANAEMIPQTEGAKTALDLGLKAGGQQGAIIRQLNSLPDKVYVTDQPDMLSRLSAMNTQNGIDGLFRPNMTNSGYSIYLRPDQPLAQKVNTLAHESGHGVAQIAGVGGYYQPTGISAIDMFANLNGGRLPKAANETLADALAGFDNRKNPQADYVRELMKKRK